MLIYNASEIDDMQASRIAAYYEAVLWEMGQMPTARYEEAKLLSAEEQQLFRLWNQTQQAYPSASYVYQWFEAQCEQHPDTLAVVFEDQQLSYRELNMRANQLAHYLRMHGVGSETLVGIYDGTLCRSSGGRLWSAQSRWRLYSPRSCLPAGAPSLYAG